MGTTHRFIESPGGTSLVIEWFQSTGIPIVEVETKKGHIYYFREFGELEYDSSGAIDFKNSPVVTLFLPRIVRGELWTVGEVHFLSTPLRERFPRLHKVHISFKKWLANFELVFSNKPGGPSMWNYYLEGSTQNDDAPIYGLPSGVSAIQSGRYFIGDGDNNLRVDKICSALRLRGVDFRAA